MLLTPEERTRLPSSSRREQHRCIECNKVITSTLVYVSDNGDVTCSMSCRDRVNRKLQLLLSMEETKETKMAKKKKHDEDDDEEVTKKNKKKVKDDDEEEEEEAEDDDEEESEDDDDSEDEEEEDDEEGEEEVTKKKKGKAKKEKKEKKSAKKGKKKSNKTDDEEEEEEEDDKKKKKDKKKKASSERTPVGTKDNPFREGSSVHKAFELLKKGMTPKEFKKFAEKEGHDMGWYLARFRKGEKRGVKWAWHEDEDKLRIKLKK